MSADQQHSDKKYFPKPGILRLDINKPRRSSGGSVEFRMQPELLGETSPATASPPTTSPQLSVTWAFNTPADSSDNKNELPLEDDGGDNNLIIPSSTTSSSHEIKLRKSPFLRDNKKGRKNSTVDELNQYTREKLIESFFMESTTTNPLDFTEQINSEDEDYSLSVSAVMHRRASTKGHRKKGYISPRRTSTQMDHVTGLLGGVGPSGGGGTNERRRSSVYTSSSVDTAISIGDGTNQESTKEQIFENIRLHKEVLQSVKLQPWSMRRKLRLVRQAKEYVARHEGALQERFATSRSTKDLWARFKILLAARWQHYRREIANISTVIIPWELRIKEIESHFGSVVASYFTFLRWLFWVNIVIAVALTVFVVAPEFIASEWFTTTDHRKTMLKEEKQNSTRLMTIWVFEGLLKYSPIFYGYYSYFSGAVRWHYHLPLAYFLTGLVVYIYSFWATLRKMAENSRMSKLSSKDDECVFSWKLFTGWDFMIGHAETAHNRIASVVLGFKEALLEEAEKKKAKRNWKFIVLRIFVNLLVLGLLIVSAGAVVMVVQRSAEPDANSTYWRRNEITVVITAISFFFPMFFEILGILECYHPRKQLRMQLARIMALNLLNLYALIFALFSKIEEMNDVLLALKNDMHNPIDININNNTNMTDNTSNSNNITNNINLNINNNSNALYLTSTTIPTITTTTITEIPFDLTTDLSDMIITTITGTTTYLYNLYETTEISTILPDNLTDCYRQTVNCTKNSSVNLLTTLFLLGVTSTVMPELWTKLNITNEFENNNTTTVDYYENSTIFNFEFEKLNNLSTTSELYDVVNEVDEENSTLQQSSTTMELPTTTTTTSTTTTTTTTTTAATTTMKTMSYDDEYDDTYDYDYLMKRISRENLPKSDDDIYKVISNLYVNLNDKLSLNNDDDNNTTTDMESITELIQTTIETFIENITATGLWDSNTTQWVEDSMLNIMNYTTEFIANTTTTMSTNTDDDDDDDDADDYFAVNCYILICKNNATTTTTQSSYDDYYSEIPASTTTTIIGYTTTTELSADEMSPSTTPPPPTTTTTTTTAATTTTDTFSTTSDYFEYDTNNSNINNNNNNNNNNNKIDDLNATTTAISITATDCIITTDKYNNTDYNETCLTGLINQMDVMQQLQLRKLCWETMFGQELVKLTVMDLVMTITTTLCMDFFRALFVRFMNKCWCWDLEKKFPKYGDFKIAENILHLINNQGQVWMGMFFSPGLAIINLFKLIIIMYLRSWTVLTCNVPHEVVFRASRSNNFYLALLLTMLFLCVLPVGYAIVWIQPSWHCGPFSNYSRIYRIFTKTLESLLPSSLHHQLDYIASPSTVIPLLLLLILIIYYLVSLTGALREANQDLKTQLQRERAEERRKMLKLPSTRQEDTNANAANVIGRWRKVLEASSPLTPTGGGGVDQRTVEQEEYKKIQARKELLARIMKKALRKSSTNTSEDDSQPIQPPPQQQPQHQKKYFNYQTHHQQQPHSMIAAAGDDETDTEQHESLPHDQEYTSAPITIKPALKEDHHHQHQQKSQSNKNTKTNKQSNICDTQKDQQTICLNKPAFTRMKDMVQLATKKDPSKQSRSNYQKMMDKIKQEKPITIATKIDKKNAKIIKDNDDPISCQERVVSERRKSLLKRQNKLNENDFIINNNNNNNNNNNKNEDINYKIINEKNKAMEKKSKIITIKPEILDTNFFKFDTESVSGGGGGDGPIISNDDDDDIMGDHVTNAQNNYYANSDDDNTSYKNIELSKNINKNIKKSPPIDNTNNSSTTSTSKSSDSLPKFDTIKKRTPTTSHQQINLQSDQMIKSKQNLIDKFLPSTSTLTATPKTPTPPPPTTTTTTTTRTTATKTSSTFTHKKPKKSLNSFLTLVKEAVQVKKQQQDEEQQQQNHQQSPFIGNINSPSDSSSCENESEEQSKENVDSKFMRKRSERIYSPPKTTTERPKQPKREDSETSIWSVDNIPVITISKTESKECILEVQLDPAENNPNNNIESEDNISFNEIE